MATKARKDKKGYVLRTGECQRKDGRYSYSYTDRCGVRHSIYAKTLVKLREREKTLQRAYDEGIYNVPYKVDTTRERDCLKC